MLYNERLKSLRINNKKTQEELANVLGIKRNTYTSYETEEIVIPIKHLITLCDYFNTSIDYIFGFSKIKVYDNEKRSFNLELSGNRLKDFRKENNMSQARLSIILKCSTGTIPGYERGRYLIAIPFLYTICKKYKISADYLLGKIDNPKYLK